MIPNRARRAARVDGVRLVAVIAAVTGIAASTLRSTAIAQHVTPIPEATALPSATALPTRLATPEPTTTPMPRAQITVRPGEVPIALRLLRLEPAPGAKVASVHPEISASLAEAVDPTTVRLALDGIDVTSSATIASRAFSFIAPRPLEAKPHEVSLAGRTTDGDPFVGHWTFVTTGTDADTNFLGGLEPAGGTRVTPTHLTVSGYTLPLAHVRVVGTTTPAATIFVDGSDASALTETVADRSGYFEAALNLADRGSGIVDIRIVSIATSGGIVIRTLRLRE